MSGEEVGLYAPKTVGGELADQTNGAPARVSRGRPVAQPHDWIPAAAGPPRTCERREAAAREAPPPEPAARIAKVGTSDPAPGREEIAYLEGGGTGRTSGDRTHRVRQG